MAALPLPAGAAQCGSEASLLCPLTRRLARKLSCVQRAGRARRAEPCSAVYANEQEVASSRRPTPWPVPCGRPLSSSHGAMAAMPETLDRHGAAGLRFAPECARGHRRRQCRCRLGRVGRRWVPRRSRVLGAPGVHTVLFGSLLQAVPNSVCNSTGTAQLVECMYGGVRDFLFTARFP